MGRKWDGTYKARLTVDGSRQKKGIHYFETRSDTISLPLLCFMLCLIMIHNLIPYQFDVPNAFLQSKMDTPVYLRQPQGFIEVGKQNWVWKLKKCVYGLKQASLQWRSTFHDFITEVLGFKEIGYNSGAYSMCTENGLIAFMLVYVDDFILACNDENATQFMVQQLELKFKVKSLGEMKQYLGMKFHRKGDKLFVNQSDYIEKLLKECNMVDLSPVDVPQPDGLYQKNDGDMKIDFNKYSSVIGKLVWLSVCTRPDISFYVSYYAQFTSNPTEGAWNHLIQIVRYLNGTKALGIVLNCDSNSQILQCYCDAGHANESMERRSIHGNIYLFTSSPIQWTSKRIHSVIKSAMEAEYIALSEACHDGKYLLMICKDTQPNISSIHMMTDNTAAKSIAEGSGQVRKVKHLETRFHMVRQMILEKQIELKWIPTKENTSDIFTKHIGNKKLFKEIRDRILVEF